MSPLIPCKISLQFSLTLLIILVIFWGSCGRSCRSYGAKARWARWIRTHSDLFTQLSLHGCSSNIHHISWSCLVKTLRKEDFHNCFRNGKNAGIRAFNIREKVIERIVGLLRGRIVERDCSVFYYSKFFISSSIIYFDHSLHNTWTKWETQQMDRNDKNYIHVHIYVYMQRIQSVRACLGAQW